MRCRNPDKIFLKPWDAKGPNNCANYDKAPKSQDSKVGIAW